MRISIIFLIPNRVSKLTYVDEIVDYNQRPFTPPSGVSSPQQESPEQAGRTQDLSDVEYDDERPHRPEPKRGGYESRVEQILYENPDPILITYGGKNAESGGGYIVYTIQTGVCSHDKRPSRPYLIRDRTCKYVDDTPSLLHCGRRLRISIQL